MSIYFFKVLFLPKISCILSNSDVLYSVYEGIDVLENSSMTDIAGRKDCELFMIREIISAQSSELWNRFKVMERKVEENILPFVHLPDYTDHGKKHSQAIEHNLSRLIPTNMSQPPTAFECFALLCAVLLHDAGMVVTKSSEEKAWEVRVDHFNRSRDFIITHCSDLGLSSHEARVIGEICRAHGMPNLNYLIGATFSIQKYGEVRVPMLSAFLRLADILDVTSDRAPDIIAKSRSMPIESRKHWDLHECISDVQIKADPSWDIRIVAYIDENSDDRALHELRNAIQNELDIMYPVLRAHGVFFKKVELSLDTYLLGKRRKPLKNPFLLLSPFTYRNAWLFAGRDGEIQHMIEKILQRRMVVLIGQSGVGKSSLVEAGVVPKLKEYNFRVIRFSFQDNPISDLLAKLKQDVAQPVNNLPDALDKFLQKYSKKSRVLIIGDHLEQMFTVVKKSSCESADFISQISLVLGSSLPVTFLFCIRDDYLPQLYNLSQELPDLYDRNNTFMLHRLNAEKSKEALLNASKYAAFKLSNEVVDAVTEGLSYDGDGMVYPPYLQIVGHRLYAYANTRQSNCSFDTIPKSFYERLGGVHSIVDHYFDGLLDQYDYDDKSMVAQILSKMATEYYTKKRVKREEIQRDLPHCYNLDKLLSSLVQHRIIRRTLGEYELVHDHLAERVIKFIENKKFFSPPVRKAIEYIEKNCHKSRLTSINIAKAAGVSPVHLARLFRNQLNKTTNRVLNEAKVAKAKTLLKSRNRLCDIAINVGFNSLSSFSRKFKEIDGTSPLGYRKEFHL